MLGFEREHAVKLIACWDNILIQFVHATLTLIVNGMCIHIRTRPGILNANVEKTVFGLR